jgi:diaminopimelate epimerase
LIDAREAAGWMNAEAAARWCDRRRGIGADGVLTLLRPTEPGAAARMHIYNADGSEPEMCGNGLRCAVSVLAGPETEGELRVETPAGLRGATVLRPGWVRTALGIARPEGRVADVDLEAAVEAGWAWSLGNPHLVLWTEADPAALAQAHGARLERHAAFPRGVNVGFARMRGPGAVELVVHERGVGITLACGTGAAAAAAAAVASGRAEGDVDIELPGGRCRASVGPLEGEGGARAVSLEGPARVVFRGELDLPRSALRQRV